MEEGEEEGERGRGRMDDLGGGSNGCGGSEQVKSW